MDSLPFVLTSIWHAFQPLMRVEVFESFCYLLTGLLIGEAKSGTVRASGFAPADYGRVLKLLMVKVRGESQTRNDSQRGQSPYRA